MLSSDTLIEIFAFLPRKFLSRALTPVCRRFGHVAALMRRPRQHFPRLIFSASAADAPQPILVREKVDHMGWCMGVEQICAVLCHFDVDSIEIESPEIFNMIGLALVESGNSNFHKIRLDESNELRGPHIQKIKRIEELVFNANCLRPARFLTSEIVGRVPKVVMDWRQGSSGNGVFTAEDISDIVCFLKTPLAGHAGGIRRLELIMSKSLPALCHYLTNLEGNLVQKIREDFRGARKPARFQLKISSCCIKSKIEKANFLYLPNHAPTWELLLIKITPNQIIIDRCLD